MELRTSELRIWNLLEFTEGEICKVKFIGDKTVTIELPTRTIRTTIDDIYPIPLTEEWVEKLGFAKIILDNDKNCYEYSITSNDKFIFHKSILGNYVRYGILGVAQFEWSKFNIYYVHQLQNFYFALTGEELQITETAQ